jgi:hypothetical protein
VRSTTLDSTWNTWRNGQNTVRWPSAQARTIWDTVRLTASSILASHARSASRHARTGWSYRGLQSALSPCSGLKLAPHVHPLHQQPVLLKDAANFSAPEQAVVCSFGKSGRSRQAMARARDSCNCGFGMPPSGTGHETNEYLGGHNRESVRAPLSAASGQQAVSECALYIC